MERFEQGSITGFLHRPSGSPQLGVVLTHGAGADCRAPLLYAVAVALADAGALVLRCDLAFRKLRPHGPPFPASAAQDRQLLRDAAGELRRMATTPVVLAGHSYGGRQASMLAAEDGDTAQALLLLSYPLHPPKKPEELRTLHFPQLKTRCHFVHGSSDPFGTPAEMEQATALIPAHHTLAVVAGAGHDLKGGKFALAALTVKPLLRLLQPSN